VSCIPACQRLEKEESTALFQFTLCMLVHKESCKTKVFLPEPESPAPLANPRSSTANRGTTALQPGDLEERTRLFPPCESVTEHKGVPVQQENEDTTVTSPAPHLSGGE